MSKPQTERRGRPRKRFDETGTRATTEIEIKMSKADYLLNNTTLAETLEVSQTTVRKYRKMYSAYPKGLSKLEFRMADADYKLSDKELMFVNGVSQHTVAKYRKIYGSR